MWTERHLEEGEICTLVTSRSDGSSYLNRVELQNPCLSITHANLYIPSTIHGSSCDETGAIDYDKLKKNLDTASDVYISRCDQAPFAGSQIHLFKGCTDLSKKLHERQPLLLTSLKGSKKAKASLKEQQSLLYITLLKYGS